MTTKTTTHLKLQAVARWYDRRAPIIVLTISACAVVLAMLIAALGRSSAPAVAAVPTPPLAYIIASPTFAPTKISVASAGTNITPRTLVAYAAPDGQAYPDPIEAGRAYTVTASYGVAWLQLDVAGYPTAVWVRAAKLLGSNDLVDLRPSAAPVIVVRDAPAQPQQPATLPAADDPSIYQVASDPATQAPVATDVPIVPIDSDHPAAGNFGGPGSSSGGDW